MVLSNTTYRHVIVSVKCKLKHTTIQTVLKIVHRYFSRNDLNTILKTEKTCCPINRSIIVRSFDHSFIKNCFFVIYSIKKEIQQSHMLTTNTEKKKKKNTNQVPILPPKNNSSGCLIFRNDGRLLLTRHSSPNPRE